MTTLKITIGDRDRIDRQTRNRIEKAQETKNVDEAQPVLNFAS